MKPIEMTQVLISGALAYISAKLGLLFPVLLLLMGMMAADYVTGMMAGKVEAVDHPEDPAYGWNSKKGVKGIIKKVGYLCVIAVAMAADYVIVNMASSLGYEMPETAVFGLMVTVWYLLNEMLSVIENAGRMGAPVPAWLAKYIAVLKHKVEKTEMKGRDEI
ncbi:MAG: phage holin family protein [Lachnospiraceae bacterium]|nr:phage holin family protein [Lachnospiraceae bacterium]